MGSATGFLDTIRIENPFRNEEVRLGDFRDLHIPQSHEARRAQASRCMNCGVPFCQSDYGCPLHNLIPEWNDLLWRTMTIQKEKKHSGTTIPECFFISRKPGAYNILTGEITSSSPGWRVPTGCRVR